MTVQFIATILGEERSGVMRSLAQQTNQLGGIWLDSRVSQLGGRFVGLIKIEIGEDKADELKAFFEHHDGLITHFNDCNDLQQSFALWSLTYEARDKSGLIDQITQALAEFAIDIDDMESHRYAVVELGQSVLSAYFSLRTPIDFSPEPLQEKLQHIDQQASIEITQMQ
ncbi:ACT domain-containing protein [Thalassotalea sp. Y01]|uniref:glycine cleavage system protein R n=1 Tax=Thalassotalea sp. Y01 TaxID=2729613 RepID=UPI00145F433D|nr:ACT domain-containing protein [Thalassotalea sp. Y01]NMP15902.1 hypothetical protein [Thalassotalea sp. Y01]